MADTKQYIIGTSDQAGKLKHKDYTEWVDSITGTVVKAPGTSSTDKANGTIISLASNLDELENTRIYDAIDIEWAPYKIKHYNNGSTVEEPLRTTSDVINNINNLYTYSTTSSYNFSNAYNNLKSYVLTTYNNTKTAHNNLNSYVLTTYNNVKTAYDNLKAYVLTTYNNINTSYNNLNSYVLTTYNNVKTAHNNLNSYVLTTYNNGKNSYDNLKAYVLTTYNNVNTSYNNLYTYVLTLSNSSSSSNNDIKTAYNNLYSYVLTTYNNVRTSYNNLYSYTTTKCASIESNINNLDVSTGNYKSSLQLPIMTGNEANQNTTVRVITGITQTDGKISYTYSGLYITPTLINDGTTKGKFLTSIISASDEDNVFTMVKGNIDIKSGTNTSGNAITNVSVNTDGDIIYEKGTTFATKSELDALSTAMPGKANNSTFSFYLSNTSSNGTSSSGSFTTNQSSNSSIYLNNVARTNSTNTFTDDQTATAWYVSSDINYKEIIDDCKITIDEISKLPIFDYIWKLDEEKKLHTGSSAQAVEEILPNLVTEDNEGIKSLDYASLGAIAGILACREICKLRDKIDKLDKIIENKL